MAEDVLKDFPLGKPVYLLPFLVTAVVIAAAIQPELIALYALLAWLIVCWRWPWPAFLLLCFFLPINWTVTTSAPIHDVSAAMRLTLGLYTFSAFLKRADKA